MRRFTRKRVKTTVEAVVGKTARVIEAVDNFAGTGRVKIDGMEWAARSYDDGTGFAVNDLVVVEKVEGVKLVISNKS